MNKILVVDDDERFRSSIVQALKQHGYATVEARNGLEGLRLAHLACPDLVLSDVSMEEMDGLAMLENLRSSPVTSATPVILMTGQHENAGMRATMELGADDYLSKPFPIEAMLASIRARLERLQVIKAREVAESERLLRTILNILPQRVFWKDREGRYGGANDQFLADCGMEAVEGKTDYEMPWTREQAEEFRADDRKVIESGAAKLGIIEQIRLSSDKLIWASTSKVPMRNQSGEIVGVLGTYLDISALKRGEQERQLMEVQLRQAHKLEAIGQLAAGIAHEINTPTQYVGDNTRFLQESFQNIQQVLQVYEGLFLAAKQNAITPELVGQVEEAVTTNDLTYLFEQIPSAIKETLEGVQRITKIVRAMKEFSHPGNQEKAAADLNRAIESTVAVARNEWKYVADLELDLAGELPAVPCHLDEFNQAILNLVINAAHAIGDVIKRHPGAKGKITIKTRRQGNDVEVRISDTGTGIPQSVRPHIFEPFFTTKGVGKGTGQGLAIVYASIVKKHGGTVTFESEEGNGTTFIIRLPISPGPGLADGGINQKPRGPQLE